MTSLWKLLALFLVGSILTASVYADAEGDDDEEDGLVEEEKEDVQPVVAEKQQYEPPKIAGKPHLAEPFNDKVNWKKKWTLSEAKKDDVEEDLAKYDGKWTMEEPKEGSLEGDFGLVLKSKAKHHAISSKLDRPFWFKGNPFIVSYEVKFQNGIDCGGAYIKLLSQENKVDLKTFHDKTPYTVMFGPDKCGLDYKLHFIFRHKNPKTGEIEEKHAKKPSGSLDKYFTDKKTHLYSLVVNPDNSFEILVDNKVVNSGNLLEDVSPPVNPPKEVDDPSEKKPEEWDEREKIPDPDATKPDDWDESQPMEVPDDTAVKPDGWLDDEEPLIPDADAEKPEDWDEEMDGEWEAPLIDNPSCQSAPGCGEWTRPSIPNPLYKGKWMPPMIDNPDFQGEWKPKRITNPDFFEDLEPYKMHPINALGLELWSMTDEILFDNFLVTDDREIHERWVEQTWEKKIAAEASSGSGQAAFMQGIVDVTNDRPWLWAVFLIVIVLPIVLVIAYCCMPKEKLGVWNTLISAAEERPWLYAVYIVVFLLPIVLLSICLCPRSGPIKQEDLDAARKKTDEASPDDEGAQEAEKPEETTDATGDNKSANSKKSKAALEKEEEPENESQEDTPEETPEETPEGEEEEKTESTRRSSPRKRKTRKV